MKDLTLTGKRALVCGASRGIGRAAALALARRGASVLCLARDRERLDALVAELPGPGKHEAWVGDMTDPGGLAAVADRILAAHGSIHVLVHNTGGPPPGPLLEAGAGDLTAAFTAHLLSLSVLARKFLPGMQAEGFGRIVNVISTSVKMPIPGLGVSNTIRGAVASFAKTLSLECAAGGVTVNNVLPGFTETDRLTALVDGMARRRGVAREEIETELRATVPAGRFGRPEEVAAVIAFLASPEAGYVNGVSIPVDGGRTGAL